MSSIKSRINRIRGQLLGIERMLDQKRDCSEVLQQISAVKRAIDGLSKEIVVADVCRYIAKEDVQKVARVMDRVMSI